jgi:hypothetical protein
MAEQAGPAHGEAEEIVQEVARLAERNAEMSSAVASEQPRSRPDMRAGQFEVAASLTSSFAVAAAMDVSAIAMPFEFRLGNIGDDVVLELPGRFEVAAAAMRALLGMNVVLDELSLGRRLGPKNARMLAMLFAPFVVGRSLPRLRFGLGSFAALQKRLNLMFELRDPLAQLGVLRFELRNPSITRVVHDPQSLTKTSI